MSDPLAEAGAALAAATDAYMEIDRRYHEIRSDRTDAINRLNQAQKKFDDVVKLIRDGAPHGTDWKASNGRVAVVEARS